ncbi:OmpA family protein [candidate division WOR-3 bacterium]|uniref:OmpA family protein n=1 Tax=candidate division WOR-3 bacterium TaxID=2052148 RepID=A0A9D5K9H8_UNCW3|nr:OmpA family protein [candidate division WOR-3 bacterium]MBD3364069.1 OmpA family protein [candidate division WOR-3 bacterium]
MRYVGWILALLFAAAGIAGYFIFYAPLERGYREQAEEIKMWTQKVAALEGGSVTFPSDTSTSDTTLHVMRSDSTTGYGTLIATIPADILFPSDKSVEITASGRKELDKLLPALKSTAGDIIIMVHDDNVRVGDSLKDIYPSNWELTARRAALIARYFLAKGVDYTRLLPAGLSAARPAAQNSSAEGRAKNRRVEIYVMQVR